MEDWRLRVVMNCKTRAFNPTDLVDVADISRDACAYNRWDENDFIAAINTRGVVCRVFVRGRRILGYVVWKSHKDSLEILHLAVHDEFRGHRIGRQIIDWICAKLHRNRRKFCHLAVPERALGLQLFLKANGFKATAVYRKEFGDDDAFVFEKEVDDLDAGISETTVQDEVVAS